MKYTCYFLSGNSVQNIKLQRKLYDLICQALTLFFRLVSVVLFPYRLSSLHLFVVAQKRKITTNTIYNFPNLTS